MVQEIRDVVIRTRVEFDKGSAQAATRDAVQSTTKAAKSASAEFSRGVSDYVNKAIAEEKRLASQKKQLILDGHRTAVRIGALERKAVKERAEEEMRLQKQKAAFEYEAHKRFIRYRSLELQAVKNRHAAEDEAWRRARQSMGAGGGVAPHMARGGKMDSRQVNPFSTGIPALDAFNARGFQLFITASSVTMVATAVKGLFTSATEVLKGTPSRGDTGFLASVMREFTDPGGALQSGAASSWTNSFRNWLGFRLPEGSTPTENRIDEVLAGRKNANILDQIGIEIGQWISRFEGFDPAIRRDVSEQTLRFQRRGQIRNPTSADLDPLMRLDKILEKFSKPQGYLDGLAKMESIIVGLNRKRLDTAQEALSLAQREYEVTRQKFDTAKSSFAFLDRSTQRQVISDVRRLRQVGFQGLDEQAKSRIQSAGLNDLLERSALADPESQRLFNQVLAPLAGLDRDLRAAANLQAEKKQALFKIEAELGLPEIRLDIEQSAQALSDKLVPVFKELSKEMVKKIGDEFKRQTERQRVGRLAGQ